MDPTAPRGHFDGPPHPDGPGRRPVRRNPLRVVTRTLSKGWGDGIIRQSASAAFWQALSLPPLLLGLLGSLGYVAGWFGANTVAIVRRELVEFSATVFTSGVVERIIEPTLEDVLSRGRGSVVSVGFVISLWAGSSALANLVDAITAAHQQHKVRNPVWQRLFSLLLYLVVLIGAVFVLPLLAIGPGVLPDFFPPSVRATVNGLVQVLYYPVLGVLLVVGLATLYLVALPRKFPWHRLVPGALLAMAVFLVSSVGLRFYIQWVTSTGYTYGALASPIAFLLFSFFMAMAVILGAQFNNALLEMWPARISRRRRRRERRRGTDDDTAPLGPGPGAYTSARSHTGDESTAPVGAATAGKSATRPDRVPLRIPSLLRRLRVWRSGRARL